MFFRTRHTANRARLVVLFFTACCLVVFSPTVYSQGKAGKTEMQQPNLDGLVEVSFKIDASGKIQIVHINSTSPQLTEYVVNKLSKIKLSNDTAPDGKVITYRFVFKKQA
jgi:selenocysteine lyase/cysteine desulfurase